MRTTTASKTALLALAGAALLVAGCIRSYRRWDPIEFKHIGYTSTDGVRWPHRYATLPETARTYRMPRPVRVSYVDLNPTGKRCVVLIHGLGSYLKFWRYQIDAFQRRGYRVVALDLPGFGKSDKPASFPYTMEAMADTVRELLAQLTPKIERPLLVGHSMGGQTALSYAIRYPDEPAAIVLASPAGFEKFTTDEQRWFVKVFTRSLIKDAGEYAIWGSVRYNNFYRWKKDYAWLIEERVRLKAARDFDAYAHANVKSVHGLARNDFVRDNLYRVKAPTLIVFGDKDRLIPNPFMHGGFTRWVMGHGKRQISNSELVRLHNCGHMVQIDCNHRFNQTLLAFFGKQRQVASR
jgi:pimeloyl-ACP methyl ester carboxylesterase